MKRDSPFQIFAILAIALAPCACDSDTRADLGNDTEDPVTITAGTMDQRQHTPSESDLDPVPVPTFTAQDVPTSDRAREAIAEAYPRLASDLAARNLDYGQPIFIRIFKHEAELEVWIKRGRRYHHFRTWPIANFSGELGPKLAEGDRQAPEGFYFVPPDQMNPMSNHLVAFNLGYPNAYDRALGRTGSYLMVHGGVSSIGCYAMTDRYVAEIYALADAALRNGQPYFRVHCFPFRMTDANMNAHRDSEWFDFWQNLKEGYDAFEQTGNPPNARVEQGTYVFDADGE